MSHVNIEIKAKCGNPDKIRKILKSKKADFKGIDHQIDTYFKVDKGRLKLREGNIENFLIHYQREDNEGPKQSDVTLFHAPAGPALKEILSNGLDVLIVVDKQREIYFIDNVKFHVDEVEGLGSYIEIEAIDNNGAIGKDKLFEQCKKYMGLFGILESDLISCSYSDLLLNK